MKRRLAIFLMIMALSLCRPFLGYSENARETPVVRVIRQCAPMVVNIGTERTVLLQQNPFWGAYGGQFDQFFNDPFNQFTQNIGTMKLRSLGSGVLVSDDGLIVTNAHVVGMASKIFVTLQNGQTKEAQLVGMDNENDIALVQIPDAGKTPHMELSEDVLIGETVVAIGNPWGLQNSVSAGIVSGTGRTFSAGPQAHVFNDLIQTDASINLGSSGGALINLEGKLAGINFAVVENAQGLAFAVPSYKIRKMLLEYEKIKPQLKKRAA